MISLLQIALQVCFGSLLPSLTLHHSSNLNVFKQTLKIVWTLLTGILTKEQQILLKIIKHAFPGWISILQNFFSLMTRLFEMLKTFAEILEEENLSLGVLSEKIRSRGNFVLFLLAVCILLFWPSKILDHKLITKKKIMNIFQKSTVFHSCLYF